MIEIPHYLREDKGVLENLRSSRFQGLICEIMMEKDQITTPPQLFLVYFQNFGFKILALIEVGGGVLVDFGSPRFSGVGLCIIDGKNSHVPPSP